MELVTGKTGLPHVQAADDAELYKLFLGDGAYVLPTGFQLNAQLNGANKIRIFDGSLIVQGRLAKVRPSVGFDELDLAPGVIGQKRVDLVVAEYSKIQEEAIDAWIVGDSPLAIDWLSETEGGTAFTPEKGQLYKLRNTVQTYEEGTYYRWHGNVYVRSLVQELEHCETKIIQGSYNTSAYIEPAITTGDIDLGQTHQVKLWAVKFNGLNVEEQLTDYRTFLTGTPYNTLIATTLEAQAEARSLIQDMLGQVETAITSVNTSLGNAVSQVADYVSEVAGAVSTGAVLYSGTHKVEDIISSDHKDLIFDLSGVSYSQQAGDQIELYMNGLKANTVVDNYFVSEDDGIVTFTFDNALTFGTEDYAEIVVRR